MLYVDGYVLPILKKNLPAYRRMASLGGKLWMKHGALQYVECVGDDLKPKDIAFPFPQMVKPKPGETVIFSFITFKSRAHRDRVNAKVFQDPQMNNPKLKNMPMPFEMDRMAYGGFQSIVSL